MQKSIITILLLSSAAAFANEAADEQSNRASFIGERTRAELNAEVQQARASGTLSPTEFARSQAEAAPGVSRSRAEIRIEAVQAARAHVIHELF